MATSSHHGFPGEAEEAAKAGATTLQKFFTKFNNDWVMNFAAGLAFNLITALLPILIALIAIVGLTLGNLNPGKEAQLLSSLKGIFPGAGNFLQLASASLQKSAGLLSIVALLLALFGGSRLFVTLEGYFDIIYHTPPRGFLKQNLMAIGMLLIFIVLTVPVVFASSIPAVLQAAAHQIPGNGLLIGLLGIVVSIFLTWVLFEAIYLVVPNQHISFRHSWLGAVVAAVLLQVYLALFPFYVSHFLGSYNNNVAPTAGFAVILLLFFYYFAVILLLGAEMNAFFAEGIQSTPDNLAVMVHTLTSHLPTTEKDRSEQATPSHKPGQPADMRPKSEAEQLQARAQAAPSTNSDQGSAEQAHTHAVQKHKAKSAASGSPRWLFFAEALTGTALAFIVQLFQQRRHK